MPGDRCWETLFNDRTRDRSLFDCLFCLSFLHRSSHIFIAAWLLRDCLVWYTISLSILPNLILGSYISIRNLPINIHFLMHVVARHQRGGPSYDLAHLTISSRNFSKNSQLNLVNIFPKSSHNLSESKNLRSLTYRAISQLIQPEADIAPEWTPSDLHVWLCPQ